MRSLSQSTNGARACALVLALVGCDRALATMPDVASVERDAPEPSDAYQGLELSVEPGALDLGGVCVGLRGDPVELSITNPSSMASPAIRASLEGTGAASFEIVSSTCEEGLATGARCALEIVFSAAAPRVSRAGLVLAAGDWSATVPLDGRAFTCVGPAVAPAPFDFGDVGVGESERATFTVANQSSASSPIRSASITGADAGAFTIVAGTDACTGRTLGAGGSCTIDVTFSPSRLGRFDAALEAEGPTTGSGSALLSGTSTPRAAALTFSPRVQDFGSAACVGPSVEFVLANGGTAPSGPITLGLTGPGVACFAIEASDCEGGLDPGASCRVTVRFAPLGRLGAISASLEASFDGGSASAVLSATGLTDCGGFLTVEPPTLAFGAVPVGAVSSPVVFTVRNAGASETGPVTVELSGADVAAFVLDTGSCAGARLAGGGSCTFDVAFAPTTASSFSAAARVAALPGGRASAALSGTGE